MEDGTIGNLIVGVLVGGLAGLLVAWIGSFFDPSADNRYSRLAGFVVFVLIVLAYLGIV